MRYLQLAVGVLSFASLVSAQPERQQSDQAQPKAAMLASSERSPTKSATEGPAVDSAKVSGSTFSSEFFKFTYELPKDWKALDDAVRMAENQKLQDEERSQVVARPVSKTKGAASKAPNKNPTFVPQKASSYERYSLMVASPQGVDSLSSGVLPRVNVWAHKRIPPMDGIGDHAQILSATKRALVLEKPKEVSIGGHTFVRVDIVAPNGEYHSQFVTILGDYLVGFDFLATSQKELSNLAATMDSVKFQ